MAWVAIGVCLSFSLFYVWLSLAVLALYREFVSTKVRTEHEPFTLTLSL
jgi:hypothetical protein